MPVSPFVRIIGAANDRCKAIKDISFAVIGSCDALLLLAESPGANRERDLVAGKGYSAGIKIV